MNKIERVLRFSIEACGIIGTVILLAMMMMTVFDVQQTDYRQYGNLGCSYGLYCFSGDRLVRFK